MSGSSRMSQLRLFGGQCHATMLVGLQDRFCSRSPLAAAVTAYYPRLYRHRHGGLSRQDDPLTEPA